MAEYELKSKCKTTDIVEQILDGPSGGVAIGKDVKFSFVLDRTCMLKLT